MSFSDLPPLLGPRHAHSAAFSASARPGGSFRRSLDAARRSFVASLRHTAFASHAPFDPLEGATDCREANEECALPMAREEACKADLSEPVTWADTRGEARRLLSLAVPLVLQSLASMMLSLISTIFVGHLQSPVELSGVVLASSVYNVTGISLVIGLSSALDTLCGQAFGARRYKLLGVYLQRAQCICWVLCLPIAALWLNAHPLLLALGQEPGIADVAARYLRILAPSLFIVVTSDTTRRYFLAQRIVWPGLIAAVMTTAMSPVYNYTFIHHLGWRTDGAALAVLCCQATNAVILNGWRVLHDSVLRAGAPDATWGGCSPRSALKGWGHFLSIGIPAAAMICLEWAAWEVLIISAGWLPNPDVAVSVMGITSQLSSVGWMVPMSLGSATATRVANNLGAGNARGARLVYRVAVALTAVICCSVSGVIFAGRHSLVTMYTKDPATVALGLRVVPVVSLSLLGDSFVAVLGCVLRAAGRQALGASLNVMSYWVVGLPLAMLLAFRLGLGTAGMWMSMGSVAAGQAIIFAAVIARFDWCGECERARRLTALGARGSTATAVGSVMAGVAGSGGDDGGLTAPLLGPDGEAASSPLPAPGGPDGV